MGLAVNVLLVLCLLGRGRGRGWSQQGAKVSIDYVHGPLVDSVPRFRGNATVADNFKIVVQDGPALYVGGTNTIYILSSRDLKEHEKLRIHWPPDTEAYDLCIMKGKSKIQCQNYIRVVAKTDKDRLLICGTHAFKPRCRYYKYKDGGYSMDQEFDGKMLTPYDPGHNSSYLLADGELYSATVSDFSGSDPLIYKENLRTEQYDSKILNAPDFVRALEDENYVYFFFREQAVEYINCGKSVYSRVARVCKNDKGGPNKFSTRWTSYLKSRLNCSIPGDYPFYFNHLQSVSDIMEGEYMGEKTRLVYATFTTPDNAIGGNAVCAFKVEDIQATFEGAFKEQETANSNWLPVREMKVPSPRPGQCSQDSTALPESSLRFVQDHSIMDQAVPATFGASPVYIRANIQYPSQFREIAIHPGIRTAEGRTFDVMFIGTNRGQVLKIIHAVDGSSRDSGGPILIEELQVVPPSEPILGLQITSGEQEVLLVTTSDELLLLPLHRCSVASSCSACVRLQDPYCGWSILSSKCVSHATFGSEFASEFLQNVSTGRHRQCGDEESPVLIEQFTDLGQHRNNAVEEIVEVGEVEGTYSTEELMMAVVTAVVCSLIVGFIAGFLIARKCQCGGDNPYHVPYLNRSGYEEENIYAKVDDMTYYPVVSNHPEDTLNKHNIINNLLVTDHLESKTLDLHQANSHSKSKDFNTFNAFSTVHRSQKIYL